MTPSLMRSYRIALEDRRDVAVSTRKAALDCPKALLAASVRDGLMPNNPAEGQRVAIPDGHSEIKKFSPLSAAERTDPGGTAESKGAELRPTCPGGYDHRMQGGRGLPAPAAGSKADRARRLVLRLALRADNGQSHAHQNQVQGESTYAASPFAGSVGIALVIERIRRAFVPSDRTQRKRRVAGQLSYGKNPQATGIVGAKPQVGMAQLAQLLQGRLQTSGGKRGIPLGNNRT